MADIFDTLDAAEKRDIFDEVGDASAEHRRPAIPKLLNADQPSVRQLPQVADTPEMRAAHADYKLAHPPSMINEVIPEAIADTIGGAYEAVATPFSHMAGTSLTKLTEKLPWVPPAKRAIESVPGGKYVTGAIEGAQDIADSFASPLGVLTLGIGALPKVAQRAVSLAFATDMAKNLPGQAAAFKQAIDSGDQKEAAKAFTGLAGNTLFAGLAAKHGISPVGTPPPGGPPAGGAPPAEVKATLPESMAALEATNEQLRKTYASENSKAAEVHGNVQPLEAPPGVVSVEEGRGGVQPQAGGGLPGGEAAPPGEPPVPARPAGTESANQPVTPTPAPIATPAIEGVRFDHEYSGAGGKKLWQFTVQDNGPAHNAGFSVPAGASPEVIKAKIAELVKARTAPEPDWQVTVQGDQGEVPGYVQIVDPKATESSKSPTMESLRGYGHEVPDFSKLPTGKYTWDEAVKKVAELEKQPPAKEVTPVETKKEETQGILTPVTPPPAAKPAAKFRPARSSRPTDIVDEWKSRVGLIRNKKYSKPGSEGYYSSGYKEAIERHGTGMFGKKGLGPDDYLGELKRQGLIKPDATVDDMWDMMNKTHRTRVAHYRGETPEAQADAFYSAIDKKLKEKGSQKLTVGELGVGDKFTLNTQEFTITKIDPDTGEVTAKDGRKFGTQTIPDGAEIGVDKGSHEPAAEQPFEPETKPGAGKPDLTLGAPETIEQQAARLEQERIAKEAKAAEDTKAAAAATKEREARERLAGRIGGNLGDAGQGELLGGEKQPEMFKPPSPEGSKPTIFTNEAAADALARLKDKFKPKLGIVPENPYDPQTLRDLVTVAGNIVERGAIKFADFAKSMIEQFGESVRPYLKAAYNQLREHPDSKSFKEQMTPVEDLGKVDDAGQPAAEGEGKGGTYGIAERVREERAKAGQVAEVPPGEGISAPDSVERGRELLKNGADAEKALSDFEKTKKLSSDDMALVRAEGERLAKEAAQIEREFGTDSDEYRAAWNRLSEWDARSKAMQTEWHKTGQAQQGETDIDTGTFTGLQRAHKEATGKDFSEKQAAEAKATAAKVKAAEDAAAEAQRKLIEAMKPKPMDPVLKRIVDRIGTTLHTQRDAALARIKARSGTITFGSGPLHEIPNIGDYAIVGASHLFDGALDFAKWSEKMLGDFGDSIKPHLGKIFKASNDHFDKTIDAAGGKQAAAKVRQAAKAPTPKTPREAVWNKVKEYVQAGHDDFDEIRSKVATDLGMSVDEVTKLITESKPTKRLADDAWKKQQTARRVKEQAKRWLRNLNTPLYQRAITAVPRLLFSLKVGFHGTVALGTHAPMVAFQPQYWKTYVRDFGKMYKMVGSTAYYERQVQDLQRRPNFITARRAGLVNDPFQFEDYNSPQTTAYFGNLTGMGNRGYSVLKILRQDMFDHQWNQLPKTAQIPEVAQAIADGVNHATGVVKGKAPKGTHVLLFAPRLEASRVAWLAVDPIKAADTFARWKTASEGEKRFAINQVKEKATVLATMAGLLALNQGFLSATGSDQKINFDDPMKGDFLKFKAAGMNFSYGNPMLTMARLPVRMYAIRKSSGGKTRNLIYPDEDVYTVLGEYGRSQLSPFASLSTDLWFRSDWMRRQLPGSNRPMPARLRRQGVKPYTWPEFWSEEVLPIPAEEAAREVWKKGFGMSEEQIVDMRKAMATIAIMSATGARLSDDYEVRKGK